jgi:hypothetical protein
MDAALLRLLARAEAGQTTVMVRNIPNKWKQRRVLKVCEELGFAHSVDLLYMPLDFRTGTNLGYCFVNFLQEEIAVAFRAVLDVTPIPTSKTGKLFATATARVHGFANNFRAFRSNVVMSKDLGADQLPLIIDPVHGVEIPFPTPTGSVRRTRKKPAVDFESLRQRLHRRVSTVVPESASELVSRVLIAHERKKLWRSLELLVRKAEDDDDVLAQVVTQFA